VVTGDANRVNNTVTSPSTIAVTQGYVDLTGIFGTTWTLPSSVVGGKLLAGTTSVVVKNLGNVALPAGQLVNIQIVAQDTTNPSDPPITLTTLANQSVSSLAANASRTFNPYVNVSAGLSPDSYQILANIIPVQALTESADNQQVSQTALGATKTVTAAVPFVDLSAQFGTMTLPASEISGNGKLITVPVVVKNVGNVALPALQKINIEIDATLAGVPTMLKTLTGESVSSLGAGASATFTTTVTLPQSLATGAYNLMAVVDSSDAVTGDTHRANNTVTTLGTIAVTQGFANLGTSSFGTSTLPTSTTAGHALTGSVSVTLKNTGNLALPIGQLVTIQLVAYDTTNPSNAPITLATTGSLSASALAAGTTRAFSVAVNLPGGLPSDSYQIEAIITPVNNAAEFTAATYTVIDNALGNPLLIAVS
jgi:hypothetical protein